MYFRFLISCCIQISYFLVLRTVTDVFSFLFSLVSSKMVSKMLFHCLFFHFYILSCPLFVFVVCSWLYLFTVSPAPCISLCVSFSLFSLVSSKMVSKMLFHCLFFHFSHFVVSFDLSLLCALGSIVYGISCTLYFTVCFILSLSLRSLSFSLCNGMCNLPIL